MPPKIHLIYPHGRHIRCPDAIGYNLTAFLRKRGYQVINYDWSNSSKLKPGPDDVLIGHAHPNPFTLFRRSMTAKGWRKVILMEPFNHDPEQVGFLRTVVPQCDWFVAITGKYWADTLGASVFSGWGPKFIHLDLAVDRNHFPLIKRTYAEPGKRKFLYIGNAHFYKNIPYLRKLAMAFGADRFATAGCNLEGIHSHGYLDFSTPEAKEIIKQYDFLIMTGRMDANPTTILEAMAWGLIPVVTPQCGYYREEGIVNIPLDQSEAALGILRGMDSAENADLASMAEKNLARLDGYYSWDRFCEVVLHTIERKDNGGVVDVTPEDSREMRRGQRTSPFNAWRRKNLFPWVKAQLQNGFRRS